MKKNNLIIFISLTFLFHKCDNKNSSITTEKSNILLMNDSIAKDLKKNNYQLYESFDLFSFKGISEIANPNSYPFIALKESPEKTQMKVVLSSEDIDTRFFYRKNDSTYVEKRVIPKTEIDNFTTTIFSIYKKYIVIQYTIISDYYNTNRLASIDFQYKDKEITYQLENEIALSPKDIDYNNISENTVSQQYEDVSKRKIDIISAKNKIIKKHSDGEEELYNLPYDKRFFVDYYYRLGLDNDYNKNINR